MKKNTFRILCIILALFIMVSYIPCSKKYTATNNITVSEENNTTTAKRKKG